MKKEVILELYNGFEEAALETGGIECWSARDLQYLLGYGKWEKFSKVIEKSKEAYRNAGYPIDDRFPDVRKTIPMP
jgi:DNA-damage-inducible protein D